MPQYLIVTTVNFSFQSSSSHHLNKLTMKIQVHEPHEQYIVERLKLEGRGGSVTRLEEGIWQYEVGFLQV